MLKTESRKVLKRQNENLMREEADVAAVEHAAKQAKLKQQGLRVGLKALEVAEADLAIAKWFYANGISFGAASSEKDSYYRDMVKKIQAAPYGYIPPNRNKIGGALLDECHSWMWKKVDERDPDGMRAMRFGSCYISDGWDSCDHLPLINSAFITGNDGGVYWRSVDTSGKDKNAEYCAALMILDIYEFGPDKVVLIITDTCSTMRKCWSIVMDEFPWIMVLPCQAHCISLLMKDLGKSKHVCSFAGSAGCSLIMPPLLLMPPLLPQATTLIHEEGIVTQWFSLHHFPLAKLREYTVQKLGGPCELIKAAATRFGTNTLVGERLLKLKGALQATCTDESYVAKKYADKGNTEEESANGRVVRSNKGGTAGKLCLDNRPGRLGFWSRVTSHVTSTLPMLKMLRRFDSSSPTIGKLTQTLTLP